MINSEVNKRIQDWVESVETDESEAEQLLVIFWRILEEKLAEPKDLVQLLANMLNTELSYIVKFYIIQAIYCVSDREFKEFPELFWVIVKTGFILEQNDVSRAANVSVALAMTGGAAITRSYLISLLLGNDVTKWERILMAFYPVGYDIVSLKRVEDIVGPPNENNRRLYGQIHGIASWSIGGSLGHKERAPLSSEDVDYLKGFFAKGVEFENPNTIGFCAGQDKRLDELVAGYNANSGL